VDYQAGLFMTLSGGAISAGGTVYVTYYRAAAKVIAGEFIALDGGLAYVNFMRDSMVL